MKVTLCQYTQDALAVLLFTKSTRLGISAAKFEEIKAWPEEKKLNEFQSMLRTIDSPFGFVSYLFSLEGLSKIAVAHIHRHHIGVEKAEQSHRVVDIAENGVRTPPAIAANPELCELYQDSAARSYGEYEELVRLGASYDDARGITPVAGLTNLAYQVNLRALAGQCETRLCPKSGEETREVYRRMRAAVLEVHPWAEPLLRVACAKTGVCRFPDFKRCEVQRFTYNPDTGTAVNDGKPFTRDWIQASWVNHYGADHD